MPSQRRRQGQVRKADTVFSKFIRLRDKRCQHCYREDNLQCAHIWGRAHFATRFVALNAVALCASCHVFFTVRPAHFHDWAEDYLGTEAYKRLRDAAVQESHGLDYPEIISYYTDRIRELEEAA